MGQDPADHDENDVISDVMFGGGVPPPLLNPVGESADIKSIISELELQGRE